MLFRSNLRENEPGHGYSIQLSYFDMPQEVEGKLDKTKGIFHITFHYPDKEEGRLKPLSSGVQMNVGKHSGKILGFEVEIKKSDIREVSLRIPQMVHDASSKITKINQKKNYSIVQKVLNEFKEPLYSELALA